jgi:hypothetical protein
VLHIGIFAEKMTQIVLSCVAKDVVLGRFAVLQWVGRFAEVAGIYLDYRSCIL